MKTVIKLAMKPSHCWLELQERCSDCGWHCIIGKQRIGIEIAEICSGDGKAATQLSRKSNCFGTERT